MTQQTASEFNGFIKASLGIFSITAMTAPVSSSTALFDGSYPAIGSAGVPQ